MTNQNMQIKEVKNWPRLHLRIYQRILDKIDMYTAWNSVIVGYLCHVSTEIDQEEVCQLTKLKLSGNSHPPKAKFQPVISILLIALIIWYHSDYF